MQEHTPVEIQIKKHLQQTKAKTLTSESDTPKTLDGLIKELYKVKDRLRDFHCGYKQNVKRPITHRKNEILKLINEELGRVNSDKAKEIKNKLWDDLGVLLP